MIPMKTLVYSIQVINSAELMIWHRILQQFVNSIDLLLIQYLAQFLNYWQQTLYHNDSRIPVGTADTK